MKSETNLKREAAFEICRLMAFDLFNGMASHAFPCKLTKVEKSILSDALKRGK